MITIEEINKYKDVLKLKDAWNELNENGPDEVSLSFEWIVSLWESHLNKEDAIILMFKKEDRLIGIAPLYKKGIKLYHFLPVMQIGLMSNLYCNHNDFIINEDKDGCLEAMFRYLEKKRISWDLFNCSDLLSISPNIDIIKNLSKRFRFGIKETYGDRSPYLPIEGSFEEYLAKKSKKTRRDLIPRLDKIKSLGIVEVKTYCGDGPFEPVINKIYEIEKKSWKEIEKSSITASHSQMEFYRSFGEKVKGKGWLYIKFFELNGEAIAHLYLLKYKNRIVDLKGSYIDSYKDYSPGKVLRHYLMIDIYSKGIKEIDFTGKAEEWKMSWTHLVRDHKSLIIYNKKSCAHLFYKIQEIYKRLSEIGNNNVKSIFKKIVNKCMFLLFFKIKNILYVKELDKEIKEIKLKKNSDTLSIKVITKYDDDLFNVVKKIRPKEEREKHLSRFNRKDICFVLTTSERELIHISWVCYKEIEVINVKMRKNLYLQEKEFYVHDCFTNEMYRGQSIYPYMLSYILKYHKDCGFKRVFIDVESLNLSSIRGIEKAGFERNTTFTLYTLLNYFNFLKEKNQN